ncbi:MAG: DNA translocase FtsK [Oscillospiraceae bacterium]|nr:DNA translocase FtsK [Oscillospiraceae bacterium]
MAQKKAAGKTGAKKKAAPAPARQKSPARRYASGGSAAKSARPAPKQQNPQLHSVLMIAAGVLIAAFAFVPGTRAWAVMQNLLRGMFGIGVALVPIILIVTGWLIGQERSQKASARAVWGILLTLAASALVQVFLGDDLLAVQPEDVQVSRFTAAVKVLWENGKELRGGGLISGILVVPLVAAFDVTGARIVITLIVIVLLMLLTNRGIVEMLQIITKPFVWIWHGIEDAATRGYEGIRSDFYEDGDDEYDDEDEDEDAEEPDEEPERAETEQKYIRGSKRKQLPLKDEEEPEEEPLPKTPRRKRREEEKQMEEVAFFLGGDTDAPQPDELHNIDVDVPIYDHNDPVPEEQMNRLTPEHQSGVESIKDSLDDDAQFQSLVEEAAKESDEQANRLPWLDRSDAKEDPSDESKYEEEPEIPYIAPRLDLLNMTDNSANDADKSMELREKGKLLVDTLASFGVSVRITGIRRGPTVTRYEIQPAAGVKIAKITALADDIGLNLGGKSVRIEAPIPGKPAVGVEVPNNHKDTVTLRELLETPDFQESKSKLTFAVGKDIDGHVILGDIAKMPHMIIAGTTGSGKSVCTNSIIMSILFHASPDEVRLILIDPKVVEFQPYDGIPHLLIPVITQPQKAAGALNWAVLEMERRYMLCATYGVRDLKGYNAIAENNPELKRLPQIVIIIDEFADLMMSSGKEVEAAVIRIAQKARAAGIHLIIATQRPTVDVITGLIKSNVPSRIGMSVKSAVDSRTILDSAGAETLLGNGDLLFYPNGWREPKRVQGCFVSDKEVEAVTSFLKSGGVSEYDTEIMDAVEQAIPAAKGEKTSGDDDLGELTGEEALILRAAEVAVDAGQISTTALQRRLKLGYAKAARIVDEMEERGIIGPSEGAKPRKVIMTPQELTEWKLRVASKGNKVE